MRVALLVSLAVIATAAGEAVAQATPCEPAVAVTGDEPLAAELAVELALSGIHRRAEPACPLFTVEVRRREGRIELDLADPFGRSTRRVAGTVPGAAAVVASWARQSPIAVDVAPPALAPVASAAAPEVRRAVDAPAPRGGITLAVGSALDRDDRLWSEASISACVSVGPVCVGGLARVGRTRMLPSHDLDFPVLVGGGGYDVVAIVGPSEAGEGLTIAPEFMFGYGVTGFDWQLTPSFDDHTEVRGVRFGGRVVASRPFGRGYSLELSLSLEALAGSATRYDRGSVPERVFEYNPTLRASIGVRHGR